MVVDILIRLSAHDTIYQKSVLLRERTTSVWHRQRLGLSNTKNLQIAKQKTIKNDMGYHGKPFRWDEARRAQIRTELDAYYARLYRLTRDELRYIVDPKEVYGDDFPGETFRVLKEKEIKQFGEYRTQRLVLKAWDRVGGK